MKIRLFLLPFCASIAHAEPQIVSDIAPVGALVSAVLGEKGQSDVLIDGASSPHSFALKPSQASAVQDADIVFLVSDALTPLLIDPIENLAGGKIVQLAERTPEGFHLQSRKDAELAVDDDGHEHDHDHEGDDPHFWLDPEIAIIWLDEIAGILGEVDPENAALYLERAAREKHALAEVRETLSETFQGQAPRYVVVHDSLQYFENRFGLFPLGAITASDAEAPSVARMQEFAELGQGADCALIEKGTSSKAISNLFPELRQIEIDLFGDGRSYSDLIETLGQAIASCK